MNQNILHIGLDVDDTQYHGSAFNKQTGEVIDFRCRPTLKGLLNQLDKVQRHFPGLAIRLCYEASYVGFHLQRDLSAHGWHCINSPCRRACNVAAQTFQPGSLMRFAHGSGMQGEASHLGQQARAWRGLRERYAVERERLASGMWADGDAILCGSGPKLVQGGTDFEIQLWMLRVGNQHAPPLQHADDAHAPVA